MAGLDTMFAGRNQGLLGAGKNGGKDTQVFGLGNIEIPLSDVCAQANAESRKIMGNWWIIPAGWDDHDRNARDELLLRIICWGNG